MMAHRLASACSTITVLAMTPARYRRQMVRVAAIAVAALEALDRKCPHLAPGTAEQSLAPGQPIGLAWWQQLADSMGEALLLLDRKQDVTGHVDDTSTYAICASQADTWERENALAQLKPRN